MEKGKISLERFFYLSDDYMFVLNREGMVLAMNPSLKQLLGIKSEKEIQINFYDLVYFEDVRYIYLTLQNCIKGGYKERNLECRLVEYETKRLIWLRLSSVFHSEEQIFVCAQDITDLKNKHLELSDDKSKLLHLIELVPHPIFLKNKNGKYVLLNDAQAALFGMPKQTFLGKDDAYFIHDRKELELVNNSDREVVEFGRKVTLENHILRQENGEETILHTTKIPFRNSFDSEVYILGVSIDLTEIKEVEMELRKTNFELDSFVYKASHDLRAPLCSITGLLNLVSREQDPSIVDQCVLQAKRSVQRLDTYISDLTNLTRNSRLEVVSQHIDFISIIDNCFEHLKYMDHADRINLQVRVDPDVEIQSDKGRIRIIFMNLISNAIKYQRNDVHSFLKINVYNKGQQVCIDVEDNGWGIKAKYLPKVYDMFFRASEKSFGSGLGLYIVKQIIEKLNARIHLKSKEGQGTTFHIELPNKS